MNLILWSEVRGHSQRRQARLGSALSFVELRNVVPAVSLELLFLLLLELPLKETSLRNITLSSCCCYIRYIGRQAAFTSVFFNSKISSNQRCLFTTGVHVIKRIFTFHRHQMRAARISRPKTKLTTMIKTFTIVEGFWVKRASTTTWKCVTWNIWIMSNT